MKQLVSNGADLIKVYENLSREAYFAIMDEARRRGIPVDGHVPFRVTPEEAAAAGQRTAEHPDALAASCSTAAEAERKRFANVLGDYDSLSGDEKFLAMFRHVRALYDSRETTREFQSILRPVVPPELENVRLFNDAGVLLLAGTDVGVPFQVPGISLHVELERLVEAGLSPLEALQTATLNPARLLKVPLGSIEPGKLADLVLLDGNPLEDIRNTQKIRAVVADGRLYRRADLDRLLAEVETLNHNHEQRDKK